MIFTYITLLDDEFGGFEEVGGGGTGQLQHNTPQPNPLQGHKGMGGGVLVQVQV